jgi:acyl-CoA synthetase (AMP-forming)/AMP-acid ligase II/alkylation response protein AidB-like acyl-CoA dehydrogenase/acyl carrier protein
MKQFSTLIELLQERAQHQSDRTAYIFLQDGEIESARLTYRQLEQQAKAIAAQLQALNLKGERALLLYPFGLDFIAAFFGCLYASVIAVPAYPPKNNQKLGRLQSIAIDAEAKAILAPESVLSQIQGRLGHEKQLEDIFYLPTDKINLELTETWHDPEITADSLAFLQYTSGSTGTPKGVMISHQNLLHNEKIIKQGFGHDEQSLVVGWLPLFHDMGLIGNILQPMYLGIPCVLMSPVAFLQQPIRWLKAIANYRATTSGGPNFAYDLCLRKITEEQKTTLDLSHWQVAFNGAQPVQAETLDKFAEAFACCGFRREAFYPCYGMAETTLIVSGGVKTEEPMQHTVDAKALEQNKIVSATANTTKSKVIVGCGQVLDDLEVAIVHPETLTRCAVDEVGEIWVSGPSVAQGYWQRQDTTEEIFHAYLKDTKQGPFLRTGDLGFLQEGELFITGRLKDLIIIRGQNHYPQDIEITVMNSHPALETDGGAAFAIEVDGVEQLVIVQEVKRAHVRNLDREKVIEAIRREVALEHELQVYGIALISPSSLPKTSSGKIQRRASRTAYLEKTLKEVAQWQLPSEKPIEKMETFSPKTEQSISIIDNFFHCKLNHPPIATVDSHSQADRMIQWLQGYANQRINSRLIDERRCIPPYIVLDLGNQGFFGMQIAQEYGGLGLTNYDALRVIQQVAAADLTIASLLGVHSALGTRPIANYGQAAVKQQILPLLAQGREIGAYALTESGAGSHPKGISTTATPDGKGGWLLQGEKMYIGNGSWAGSINVFAQLLDDHHNPLGMTSFVLRQGMPGLEQGPEALTMGMRGMVQNRISFNQVRVTPEMILGQPGEGMTVAQDAMMFGRLGLGAMSIGGMKRCAQLMLRYATRRTIATGSLLDNPMTLHRLHDLTTSITAVETLVKRISRLLDRGISLPEEAYMACKTAGTEFFWQAADRLMQLLGGRGYLENNIAPQIMRDARLMRIFEGPTETLYMFLGSRILNHPEQVDTLISHHFAAPQVFHKLHLAAQHIHDYYTGNHAPFSDRLSASRWAYGIIGELTTLAILQAALVGGETHSEPMKRAITWLELKFDTVLNEALSLRVRSSLSYCPEMLRYEILDYTQTIGDLEQTLAGEEQDLDPLLRQDVAARSVPVQQPTPSSPKSVVVPSHLHHQPTHTQYQSTIDWMGNWLQKNLKVPVDSLNPSKAFAEYGMDSVMAVEFAQELETWLEHTIEPTVVWNYTTPQSLAQYLVETITGETNDRPQVTKEMSLKEMLEDDLAELLAQEIEQSKHFEPLKVF